MARTRAIRWTLAPHRASLADMAKTDYKSIDDYIAVQPEAVRGILEEVRGLIRKALPKAQEVISYQIPAYKIDGATVVYFSGWKAHYSLHPVPRNLTAALKKELEPYHVTKGAIRFPLTEPVPKKLIAAIAKMHAEETAAVVKRKAVKKKPAAKKVKR